MFEYGAIKEIRSSVRIMYEMPVKCKLPEGKMRRVVGAYDCDTGRCIICNSDRIPETLWEELNKELRVRFEDYLRHALDKGVAE